MKTVDLIGKRFGRLVVQRLAFRRNGYIYWECICDCGNIINTLGSQLRTGKSKSCGCYKRERTSQAKRKKPFEALYNVLVGVARNYGHKLELTYEEYIEFTNIKTCHYCDTEIPWNPYGAGKSNAYYLDRKDNAIGYIKGNCVVCCTRCNWSKGSRFDYNEWSEIGKTIKEYHERHRKIDN